MRARSPILALLVTLLLTFPAQAGPDPDWIWHADPAAEGRDCFARRQFHVSNRIRSAELRIAGGAHTRIFLNGASITLANGTADVTVQLRLGRNVLAAAAPAAKPTGFIALLVITLTTGQRHVIATDRDWKTTPQTSPGWTALDFDDSAWPAAKALAPHGAGPWGKALAPD